MNVILRAAAPADAPAFADIHIRSWIYAYTGLIPDEVIEANNIRRPVLWRKMLECCDNGNFAAELDGRIIGIISLNPPRETDLPSGTYELTALYLDPDYIGKGFGHQVMKLIKAHIRDMGFSCISVWALEGNHRACRFYEKCGFIADGVKKNSGIGSLDEVRYQLRNI